MGDILSPAGYATAIYGKWRVGDKPGRYPPTTGSTSGTAFRTATTNACGPTIRSMTPTVTPCRMSSRVRKAVRSKTLSE